MRVQNAAKLSLANWMSSGTAASAEVLLGSLFAAAAVDRLRA